jgi:hypothetical protein
MLSRVIGRIKKLWQRRRSLSMALAGGALLNGCAALGTDSVKPPVTISEVIQMSKENVPADTIVNRMRESKAVYRLNATGLVRLHDQGVSDPVLDYMQRLTSTPSGVNKFRPIGTPGKCGAITFGKQGERETNSRRGASMNIRCPARRDSLC